jgi:hypothetical protein
MEAVRTAAAMLVVGWAGREVWPEPLRVVRQAGRPPEDRTRRLDHSTTWASNLCEDHHMNRRCPSQPFAFNF